MLWYLHHRARTCCGTEIKSDQSLCFLINPSAPQRQSLAVSFSFFCSQIVLYCCLSVHQPYTGHQLTAVWLSLFSLYHVSLWLLARGVASKPVDLQSFSLWSGLISHLRSSVRVKCRRVHLKFHSDCFLGSEAVDVLTEHIIHVKGLEGVCVLDSGFLLVVASFVISLNFINQMINQMINKI